MIIYDLTGKVEYLPGVAAALERVREVNGEISIKFPLAYNEGNKHVFDMVEEESIVELPTDGQQYRIKKKTRQLKGKHIFKNVEAHHLFFDIIDKKINKEDARTGSFIFNDMMSFTLAPTGWQFVVVSGTFYSLQYENFGGDNCLKLFQDLIERHNAEYWPDSITKTVYIYKRMGKATDAQIRLNHNLKTIKEDVNTNDLSTRITGYGKAETDEAGNVISQIALTYISPNESKYDIKWAADFSDERYTTTETLQEALVERLQDEPSLSMEIEYVELKKKGQNIHVFELGDDIFTIVERMNVDIMARVVKIVDYPLARGLKQPKLTISNIRKSIKDLQAQTSRQAAEAQKTSVNASKAANAADKRAQSAEAAALTANQAAAAAQNDASAALTGLADKADKNHSHSSATTSAAGFMSAQDKTDLENLKSAGGEANQNAFSNVKVGAVTLAADTKTDTLEIVSGPNIELTPDATTDKLTIGVKGLTGPTWTPYTPINGFTIYGPSFVPPGYKLNALGQLIIRGFLGVDATIPPSGTVIFTLPAELKPAYTHVKFCPIHTGALVRIDVSTSGQVIWKGTAGQWVDLALIIDLD